MNKEKNELRDKKVKEAGHNVYEGAIMANMLGTFHNLLIVKPECKDCYEVVNILNMNAFPFEPEEENFRGQVGKEMGFSADDTYPLLVINSDSEEMPDSNTAEKENILNFLFKHQLLSWTKSHSAYEKIGLQFVEEEFEPALDDIMRNWAQSVQFYACIKNFREAQIHTYTPRYNIYWYLWKGWKIVKNYNIERSN